LTITAVALVSDLNKSESENKTLFAITTKTISSKIRLKFFMIVSFFYLGQLTSKLFTIYQKEKRKNR